MILNHCDSEILVFEFDYIVLQNKESSSVWRDSYTIYVYGIYSEQYEFAVVYDLATFRHLIKYLIDNGLELKRVFSDEIDDLLVPFPEVLHDSSDDDPDDDLPFS